VELRAVVAAAENDVIGSEGRVPWDLPEEFEHYRRTVAGHPVIVGRRTFERMEPLPDSLNLVLTSDPTRRSDRPGVRYVTGLPAAVAAAEETGAELVYVIGGQGVYETALPHVSRVSFSRIRGRYAGDRYFPTLGPEWAEVDREDRGTYTLVEYVQPDPRPVGAS
jgi:dihydrofolate reductase